MAFFLPPPPVLVFDINNNARKYYPRRDELNDINVPYHRSTNEIIEEYRLPRAMIQDITDGFANSAWGNKTSRNHAIPNAVKVSTAFSS